MKERGKVTLVLGGQAGSEGKGKIAGYLAMRENYIASVANFMPNAGHTWVGDEGQKVMVQQLPQSVVNGHSLLLISAGSAIDLDIFLSEVERYKAEDRIIIHPMPMVIQQKHRDMEPKTKNRISSTLTGC